MLLSVLSVLALSGISIAKPTTSIATKIQKAEVADLAFLVDITGSMQPYIDGTKDAIRDIVDSLDTSEVKKLRMAFVGYRDFNDDPHFEILEFTESVNDFKSFLGTVSSNGGGDGPEDVFGGLEKIGELKWSEAAGTRVLIHIADAPCHGTKYHNIGGDHPQGDPEGRSLNDLLAALKRQNVEYNFGRISGYNTDKMLDEFSKVWEDTIPQFDINITRSFKECEGLECCVDPTPPMYELGGPSPYLVDPMPRISAPRLFSAGAVRSKQDIPVPDVVDEIVCPEGLVYRPGASVSEDADEASAYIAKGALASLSAGYAKARSRLGDS